MDKIVKSLVFGDRAVLTLTDTTSLVLKASKLHGLNLIKTAALGRLLTVTAFISSNLKSADEKTSVSVYCDNGTVAECCGNGNLDIRGFLLSDKEVAEPLVNGEANVKELMGASGRITVVKDYGLKTPYVGNGNLVCGDVASDFMAYYQRSEQQPTFIYFSEKTEGSELTGMYGVFFQPLPNSPEETRAAADEFSRVLPEAVKELGIKNFGGMLSKHFSSLPTEIRNPRFNCLCDETVKNAVAAMDAKSAAEMLDADGNITAYCDMCGKTHKFTLDEVRNLRNEKND